jgi:hypothetical protein
VQKQILDKHGNANLRVYAIWFNMFPGDARSKWPPDLLTDSRVLHRWDEPKAVGAWFGDRTSTMRAALSPDSAWTDGHILWDSYLLYGADAKWTDPPTGLVHWGRTIVAGRETLKADLDRLLSASQ